MNDFTEEVYILLAAHNGQEYIRQQIDSILHQDFDNWHLIVSDDGTETTSILEEYAQQYPKKITHYRAGFTFGSAKEHFMHLLRTFHDAPYIMFCDQDDVWHPDKIRLTIEKMLETEQSYGNTIPILVHSDLRVVDKDLNEIAPSFLKYSGLHPDRTTFKDIVLSNLVTGCTAMINHSLAEIACQTLSTEKMVMHDWWLALLATDMGKVVLIDRATIDYRQHGTNTVGAKDARTLINRIKMGMHIRMHVPTAVQAGYFAEVYAGQLKPCNQFIVEEYGKTAIETRFKRMRIYKKIGFLPRNPIRLLLCFVRW